MRLFFYLMLELGRVAGSGTENRIKQFCRVFRALFSAGSVPAGVLICLLSLGKNAQAEGIDISQGVGDPSLSDEALSTGAGKNDDIYLNAEVNGEMRKDMFAFRQKENGDFLIKESELETIGLLADKKAVGADDYVDLAALSDIRVDYDAEKQAIIFTTLSDKALAPYTISVNRWAAKARRGDDMEGKPRSDLAGIINYNVYANSNSEKKIRKAFDLNGVSANLGGRVSSRFGSLDNNQLLTYSDSGHDVYKSVRLDSYWSYSDPKKLVTYRAGDLITRSLPWSRSVRLGGAQIRRNFGLRPDLVTMPLPNFSGSAAVPSAVDLYINNAKRATENVPVGPFNLTDLPVVSGNNEAKLVVRDAQGRETTTTVSFFGSSELLSKNLWDFSFEVGTPRRNYGTKSGDYDDKVYATGTTRYGLSNNITLEGHAEAGENFVNGGAGTVFSLWDFGTLALAGSGSSHKSQTGSQYSVGFQAQKWGFSLTARTQGASRDYHDIVSVSADRSAVDYADMDYYGSDTLYDEFVSPDQRKNRRRRRYRDSQVPKTANQIALSVPLFFDPAALSFTYTESKRRGEAESRYAGFSLSRNFGRRIYGYMNGFQDLRHDKSYSLFAGMTVTLSEKYSASVDSTTDHGGTNISSSLTRQMGSNIGDYGWSLRDIEGGALNDQRGASGNYRSRFATFAGSVEQVDERYRATIDMDGALVIADKSIMPSNKIYDSFAVVNAGAPGVRVASQNVYYGKTGWNGRLVVPNLVSYRDNRLSIDVDSLPLDTLITETDAVVVPAYQSGVIQHFGVSGKSDYIYAALQYAGGEAVPTGSYAVIDGTNQGFDIAYDGIGVLPTKGAKYPIHLTVYLPEEKACRAVIAKADNSGLSGGAIPVTCTPVPGTVTPPQIDEIPA
ncbi:MAG: fimbrial biogenesis outer membrane usher protein [Candidatus Tokpelaia sp.]|nr:MAG: fimbrial biogenesis outer membrane usher protein [Candidatus Tokpelaia sp.]